MRFNFNRQFCSTAHIFRQPALAIPSSIMRLPGQYENWSTRLHATYNTALRLEV